MNKVIRWDEEFHNFILERLGENPGAWLRGIEAWEKPGIVISGMRYLNRGLYAGSAFDNNCSVIIPNDSQHFPAILAFCQSEEYFSSVRSLNPKVSVTDDTFVQVPFDLERWTTAAEEFASQALIPQPYSDDPTQWLFHGHPAFAESGSELHAAFARLAGYRWPAETDAKMRLADLARERIALAALLPDADADGLLPLHATGANRPLADRLRSLLATAYGAPLTPTREAELVCAADARFDKKEAKDATLEGWLRERAFRQHCVLFHNRPFLWQVWDGLKDGFSAFLHYHRLDRAALEKLTYTLLGDWIARAKAEGQTAREQRALQLQQRLRLILDGKPPYDIFVRWKPLARQPIGWEPDLDDGVRLNIRPFLTTEVLRERPKGISWGKDRGTDVASAPWFHVGLVYGEKEGSRINDHHLPVEEKRKARAQAAE